MSLDAVCLVKSGSEFLSALFLDIVGAGNETQTYRTLCLLRLGKLKKNCTKKEKEKEKEVPGTLE